MNKGKRSLSTFFYKNINKIWPLISFIILFYGYIGFRFYLFYNRISFAEIDVRMLIAFGIVISIYNLLCVVLTYIMKFHLSRLSVSIIPTFFLIWSTVDINPLLAIFIVICAGAMVDIFRRRIAKKLKALEEGDKDKYKKIELTGKIGDFLAYIALIVLFIFSNYGYFLMYIFTVFYIWLIYDAIITRYVRIWIISCLVFLSVLPAALYGSLITGPFGFPLGGIRKHGVMIEIEGSPPLKGILKYEDTNKVYLSIEEVQKKSDIEINKSFIKKQTQWETKIKKPPSLIEIAIDWYFKIKMLKGKKMEGVEAPKKSTSPKELPSPTCLSLRH